MLSPDTKKEIAALWDSVSSAGLAPSPYIALEQISCLFFLKHLERLAGKHAEDNVLLKSSLFSHGAGDVLTDALSLWNGLVHVKNTGDFLEQKVFPWLRSIGQGQLFGSKLNGVMEDAYFQLDPTKHQALHSLVRHIQKLFSAQASSENYPLGEVLDQLFIHASINSKAGQLTTTPQIARFMISLLDPSPGQSIIDPAVGMGTLLISALEYTREKPPQEGHFQYSNSTSLVGVDLDHAQTRIAWVNLLLHGAESHICVQGNSLAEKLADGIVSKKLKKHYDFVLADVPFGGRVDSEGVFNPNEHFQRDKNSSTKREELLFIWRALALLKPGGLAGFIIPRSVLSATDDAHINLRRELLVHHHVEAVILLPGKMNLPFSNINTALLIVRKTSTPHTASRLPSEDPKTTAVWFYDVSDDSVSVDPRKAESPSTDNDLFDALIHFKHRKMSLDLWESTKTSYFQASDSREPKTKFLNPNAAVSRTAIEVKQWQVPVRTWRTAPNSPDHLGDVNLDYVERMKLQLYVSEKLDTKLLERDCIEAQNWSLELNRYKPIEQPKVEEEQSVLQLINDLEFIEMDILERLRTLREQLGLKK